VNRNLNAIVFDFDGTLAKLNIDFPLMRKTLMELIASYGVPVPKISHLLALEMIEAGRQWLASNNGGSTADYVEKTGSLIRAIEMEGAEKGELIPGIREMLASLSEHGLDAAVITRNCREAVLKLFPDIEEYCRAVISREKTPKFKPEPEHLRVALECVQALPRNAAMVGDHPMDIEVGKKLGTLTVGVLTGYYNRAGLEEAGADLVIDSAANILEYI
jgi:phosphoglycolate phosphatase